jgi:hypothetical protein
MIIALGIPNQRTRKQEKYPNHPVLTVCSARAEVGDHFKFTLNKEAIKLLNLELTGNETVSFGFNENNFFITNSTNSQSVGSKDKYRVTKQGSFSSKRLFDFLYSKYEVRFDDEFTLDASTVENFFQLGRIRQIVSSGQLESPAPFAEVVADVPNTQASVAFEF